MDQETHPEASKGRPLPDTQPEALKKWPRLSAHVICQSLGYFTPDGAALALIKHKRGEPYHCEWYWAANGFEQGRKLDADFDEDLLDINRNVIKAAYEQRHHHKGYMAEYRRALALVQRQLKTRERPMLASWFFVRGLQENRPYLWLLYAATASLGVLTHLTMLFVIGGHFIIYVLVTLPQNHRAWGEKWTGFFLGFCLAGCFTFQLHALVLPEMLSSISQTESVVDAWTKSRLSSNDSYQMTFCRDLNRVRSRQRLSWAGKL